MSCFDVQILDPNINTIEIETCIGNQPSSIDIVSYDNSSIIEINHCIITVKDILAGSGIGVSSSSGNFTISVTGTFGLTSEEVDDRVNQLLNAGNYIDLNYNDLSNTLTVSVTGLQPSGDYSIVGHSHIANDIVDFNSAVSGLIPPPNLTSLTGISGITVNNIGTDYVVSLSDPTIQLGDITDLSSDAKSFLLNPSSNNLKTLITNETGSGLVVFNDSPNFSGIPTAPTAPSGTNSDQIASTSFVRNELANLVDSAPTTLDTLNELAAALGDDPNFATTITNSLSNKANLSGAIFTGSVTIPSGTGNFNNLTVNNSGVSLVGHTHISSNITDFNSSVSGLLPNIVGSGYVGSNFSGNTYTISVTGLQPSGNYSTVGHSHSSNDIINFSSSVSGLLPVTNIVGGANINVAQTGSSFTVSVSGQLGLTQEEVDDRVNDLLKAGSYVNINYNDNLNTLTISVTGVQPSGNYSINGHSHAIADVSGLQNALDNKQPSGSYAPLVHSHLSSDITNFNSGVSGLLPSVTGIGQAVSSFVNNTYTINVSGLQPSGNYSLVGHTHIANDITNFNSVVSGLLPVKNIIPGSYTNITSTSGNFTVSVTGLQPSGNYSVVGHSHVSSDITNFNSSVSGLLPVTNILAGNNIGVSSSGSVFTVAVTGQLGLTTEEVDDRVSNLLVAGSYVNLNYDDINNNLTISITGLQPSGNYSLVGHTHTTNNITDFNSGVSGLLPVKDISGSGYVNVSSVSGTYTVSVNGLQPSGNYSLTEHIHTSSDITNFNSSVSGLISGIYAPLTGTLNQFGSTTSYQLSSIISDETGSGLLVFNTSPNFSGIPTVPTASSGTNTNQIASTSFVRAEISNLVGSAPSTLDTLNELASALGNDANFSTTITNSLAGKANLNGASFTGSISGPSGDFIILKQNGVTVSTSGHTHTTSDITDFNSSVSGLIPVQNIVSGTNINVTSVSGIYTINSTANTASESYSLVTTVFNKTGSPIPKMSAVYISGGQGDIPTISLAIATGDDTSAGTYGITFENIPNMSTGKVIVFGALTGLDTDQFNPTAPTGNVNGQVLYLSPSVSGSLTLIKPSAPNHIVAIGTIVRTHQNEGVIEVRVQNGFELEELHNVAISGVANGQFLQYNSSSQLWVPSSSGNFTSLKVNNVDIIAGGISAADSIAYALIFG